MPGAPAPNGATVVSAGPFRLNGDSTMTHLEGKHGPAEGRRHLGSSGVDDFIQGAGVLEPTPHMENTLADDILPDGLDSMLWAQMDNGDALRRIDGDLAAVEEELQERMRTLEEVDRRLTALQTPLTTSGPQIQRVTVMAEAEPRIRGGGAGSKTASGTRSSASPEGARRLHLARQNPEGSANGIQPRPQITPRGRQSVGHGTLVAARTPRVSANPGATSSAVRVRAAPRVVAPATGPSGISASVTTVSQELNRGQSSPRPNRISPPRGLSASQATSSSCQCSETRVPGSVSPRRSMGAATAPVGGLPCSSSVAPESAGSATSAASVPAVTSTSPPNPSSPVPTASPTPGVASPGAPRVRLAVHIRRNPCIPGNWTPQVSPRGALTAPVPPPCSARVVCGPAQSSSGTGGSHQTQLCQDSSSCAGGGTASPGTPLNLDSNGGCCSTVSSTSASAVAAVPPLRLHTINSPQSARATSTTPPVPSPFRSATVMPGSNHHNVVPNSPVAGSFRSHCGHIVQNQGCFPDHSTKAGYPGTWGSVPTVLAPNGHLSPNASPGGGLASPLRASRTIAAQRGARPIGSAACHELPLSARHSRPASSRYEGAGKMLSQSH